MIHQPNHMEPVITIIPVSRSHCLTINVTHHLACIPYTSQIHSQRLAPTMFYICLLVKCMFTKFNKTNWQIACQVQVWLYPVIVVVHGSYLSLCCPFLQQSSNRQSDHRSLVSVRSECRNLGFCVGENVGYNPHNRSVHHSHTHTHTYTHIHTHTHTPTHTRAHARAHTRIHTHTHTHVHMHTHTCTHVHMHTRTHAHTHTCTHTHMYTCTHAHTHTCTQLHMHAHTHTHTCTHAHTHTYMYIYTHILVCQY